MKPYTELLRPKTLEELALAPQLKDKLQHLLDPVRLNNLPNLLLEGAPGTGKTSTARIIADIVLGDRTSLNYLELNASSQRGIDTARDTIRSFVSTKAFMDPDRRGTPFKIVFLDEADELTGATQNALRNMMEIYAHNARFILSCNKVQRIIPPIQSRCLVLHYSPIDQKTQEKILNELVAKRQLSIPPIKVAEAVALGKGDMRKTCNYLIGVSPDHNVDEQDFIKILMDAQPGTRLSKIKLYQKELKSEPGENIGKILEHLSGLEEEKAFPALDRLAEVERAINEGSDPYVQLTGFLGYYYSHLKG